MAYVYYNTVNGLAADYRILSQTGFKLTPFIKEQIRDTNYMRSDVSFVAGNTNTLPGGMSMRAGGAYANEAMPTNDFTGSVLNGSFTFSTDGNLAYARAYAKFKAKCYTQADTLTALAETGSTMEMVGARLTQLLKGASHLKRGKFRDFLKTFGIKPLKKHENKVWSRPKEFGGLWLEYWMGWAPTVADINNALESLTQVVPKEPIRAGSRIEKSVNTTRSQNGSVFVDSWTGHCTVTIQASLVVTNPNQFTLQGLGLVNPAATAWKTLPFSWFADWFSNVAQVLEQMTDWYGLQLVDLNVSCKTTLSGSWVVTNAKSYYNWFPCPSTLYRVRTVTYFTRKVGGVLPIIRPKFQVPNGLSLSRGATAVSLLITMFAPSKA